MRRLPSWLIWGIHYAGLGLDGQPGGVPGEFNCEDDIDNDGNGHMIATTHKSMIVSLRWWTAGVDIAFQTKEMTMATD